MAEGMTRLEDVGVDDPVDGASTGLRGVLGIPSGIGPWPGVVVLHEAFGIDDVMRRQVRRLASAGFLAFMPDLFSDGGARRCLVRTFRSLRSGEGRAFADIESARRLVAGHGAGTGRVGVVGFCLGGGFALLAATRGFAAAAPNYATLPRDLESAVQGSCPVVASFGGRDAGLRGAAGRLEEALELAGVRHDVREYPEAGHSFLNDAPNGPILVRPLLRVMGIGPHPESARAAWERIDAFLHAELDGAPGSDGGAGTGAPG
jgi:carboxymethylenebutenolidase